VIDMPYSGNQLHPTQKPVTALAPLIRSLTLPGEIILDPFAGSGSSCAAALLMRRKYIGVELDQEHFSQAVARMERVAGRIARKKRSFRPTFRGQRQGSTPAVLRGHSKKTAQTISVITPNSCCAIVSLFRSAIVRDGDFSPR
jgi:hypothetical protein